LKFFGKEWAIRKAIFIKRTLQIFTGLPLFSLIRLINPGLQKRHCFSTPFRRWEMLC
jgi:hypothetical protein